MHWSATTQPQEEPVTYTQAKGQCRLDDDTEQDLVTGLISACREYGEASTGRIWITRTIEATYFEDEQAQALTLPRGPVADDGIASVTDGNGHTLDPSAYQLRHYGTTFYLRFVSTPAFPVQVIYTAGYGAAADVPQRYKQAVLMHIAHLWRNREAATPEAQNPVAHGLDVLYGLGSGLAAIG